MLHLPQTLAWGGQEAGEAGGVVAAVAGAGVAAEGAVWAAGDLDPRPLNVSAEPVGRAREGLCVL